MALVSQRHQQQGDSGHGTITVTDLGRHKRLECRLYLKDMKNSSRLEKYI